MAGGIGATITVIKNGVEIATVRNGEVIMRVMGMVTAMRIEATDLGISNPIITTHNLFMFRHLCTILHSNHQVSVCFSHLIFAGSCCLKEIHATTRWVNNMKPIN
ncbi:MAG: hypothetical protein ACXU9J_07800 [Syntrophales bacterium]